MEMGMLRVVDGIVDWTDDFCFDLPDDALTIREYTGSSSRRLLQTEYEIEAEFEFDDQLQDAVFADDARFDVFKAEFNEELLDELIENDLIDANTTEIALAVSDPEQEEDKGHKACFYPSCYTLSVRLSHRSKGR